MKGRMFVCIKLSFLCLVTTPAFDYNIDSEAVEGIVNRRFYIFLYLNLNWSFGVILIIRWLKSVKECTFLNCLPTAPTI